MEYKTSKEIQRLTNAFFGKATSGSLPTLDNFEAFIDASDATLRCRGDSETTRFEIGFDLGARYTQERIDAKLSGKPLPDVWIAFAPETNHFFLGTEKSVLEHLRAATKSLELESCVCSAMVLFNHGCQCSRD